VAQLMASPSEPDAIYRVGLHTNSLLESMAEVVVAWQLLRHAELAAPLVGEDDFYAGKVASARFFVRHVAPKVAARRTDAESEDGALMSLPDQAW
jgi:hypothetical protein